MIEEAGMARIMPGIPAKIAPSSTTMMVSRVVNPSDSPITAG